MKRETMEFTTAEGAYAFRDAKLERGVVHAYIDAIPNNLTPEAWRVTWVDAEPEPFDRIVSRNGGDGKVEAPAEIVQRLKVRTVGQYSAFDFHVDLCEVKKPWRMVSFRVAPADAARFKVGSEIEVVLRPAPLA